MRTEFGQPRTTCACKACKQNCRFIPGYLIPADLERMIPKMQCNRCHRPMKGSTAHDGACECGGLIEAVDAFAWAEEHLLASPGAVVEKNGHRFNIPTLVPTTKADGSCINFTEDAKCAIHEIAPFGCAFFGCEHNAVDVARGFILANQGLRAVAKAHAERSLYSQICLYLSEKGCVSRSATEKRRRMAEAQR